MAVTRYYRESPTWEVKEGKISFKFENFRVEGISKKKDGELFCRASFESEEHFANFKAQREKLEIDFSGSTKETFESA